MACADQIIQRSVLISEDEERNDVQTGNAYWRLVSRKVQELRAMPSKDR